MNPVFQQTQYRARFDWGPAGADAIAVGTAFVAVIDVLSFTTALTVAVEHGIAVLPYRWRDDSAAEAAGTHGAALAVGRSMAGPAEISLSPASISRAVAQHPVERLVLPSPNGSTISARLAEAGATVVGVSLRNAAAAGTWVRERAGERPVAVIAAGERWPDGSLRPAIEDLWGAGAFLDGFDDLSPEAGVAVAAYRSVADDLPTALANAASGRELIVQGFRADVDVAGEAGASSVVPVLQDGWFSAAAVVEATGR
ncbi:2-phosphosulfolactate phosphatase [Actinoplanes sp. NPDC024001]|uniref:2-phosphosulfolactate phosphatase n=1 Tax=Actinoplanes sp. NPDC024001 TaxID=3154598 RepID=UPI0033F6E1CB